MSSRFIRIGVARLLLGALLFAQAAIASAACSMHYRAPALAFAPAAAMPCHEEPTPNANLCLVHCTSADQSADTPQMVVPVWGPIAFLLVDLPIRDSALTATPQHPRPAAAGPPPRILFQSLQI